MRKLKIVYLFLFAVLSTMLLSPAEPRAQNVTFPTFGSGPIEVYLFTDYFCPPCRAMEPHIEPVLKELLKKNAITLTLVDVPFSELTPLYARYFLFSLHGKREVENAFYVRNALIEAAQKKVNKEDKLVNFLREKGITCVPHEVKEAFDRYNALIQGEKIDATPTCVIVRSGKKEKSVGGPDIVAALKKLL